ncbi:unnamed protein product [Microthlaspi erraticum]|uniref:Uncharacterized protein n=1 Tax=Microthlaspi erraticum TaxID=1685480 RepID=A0A6D2J1U1_9BRAS|nr:unnamed protein product [Microthlaspi erraticum]
MRLCLHFLMDCAFLLKSCHIVEEVRAKVGLGFMILLMWDNNHKKEKEYVDVIQADAAEAHRRKAAEEALEAERVADRTDREEAERAADQADRRAAAERAERARQRKLKGAIPGTSPLPTEGTSGQARLKGIPDVIKMSGCPAPAKLTDDGRSWMSREILLELIPRAGFPDSLEFRLPEAHERPYDAPPGWMCVYECMFTEFGMSFPLSPMLLRFAAERDVPTSHLTHGVIRYIVFTEALAKAAGFTFDRLLFEHVTDLRTGSMWERDFKRFHTTMKYDIVFGNYRNKIHWWKNYFFFVKICRASVGKIKADQIKT